MSGWTVLTLRAKPSKDYEYSRWDNHDPAHAVEDIVASAEADSRVLNWTLDSPNVYMRIRGRYDWETAEEVLDEYGDMVRDAVALGANDTSDMGTARYYPEPTRDHTHEYAETEHGHVGAKACAIMYANHGVRARDPFHERIGKFDDRYAEDGTVRLDDD